MLTNYYKEADMSIAKKTSSSLGYTLKKTQHALRLQMDEALKEINLTTPQYAVLAQLELEPGISNAELARRSFITAQTMHGIVAKLEQRGLIKREKSPNHGRVIFTNLSEKGLEAVQKAHRLIRDVESKMMSTISHDDKIIFEKLLLECLKNLSRSPHTRY